MGNRMWHIGRLHLAAAVVLAYCRLTHADPREEEAGWPAQSQPPHAAEGNAAVQSDGGSTAGGTSTDPSADVKPKKASKPKVKVGGILQVYFKQRFEESGDHKVEPNHFRVAKARVQVEGTLNRYLSYQLEIDPRSPQIEGVMRDAYIGVHLIPGQEIRIGQQKTPWGYENLELSQELYTVTRTEISEGPGRGFTLRDIGIGLRGKIPLGDRLKIEDAFAVVNGDGMSAQADHNKTKNFFGRLGLRYKHEDSGLDVRLGISGAVGDLLEDAGPPELPVYDIKFRRVGGDVQLDHPWFFAVVEYAYSRDISPELVGGAEDTSGYYALLAGKTPLAVGPVVRYERFADAQHWTFGAYYGEPKATFRCLAQFEILREPEGRRDDRLIVATQIRF